MQKILKLVLLLFVAQLTNAQLAEYDNPASYSLSSPNISNLEKYKLHDINHYTGKVDVTIPIYTIKTGNISYPIDLVYNTGGIKVDQIASNVGLGFSLTSSFISRTINYQNDFDNTGNLTLQSDVNTYSLDDIKMDNIAGLSKMNIGYFLQKELQTPITGYSSVDNVPDTYHFFCEGRKIDFFFVDENTPMEITPTGTKMEAIITKKLVLSGKFVNVRQPNGQYEMQDVKSPMKDFTTIKITTNKGVQYTFEDCDYAMMDSDFKPQISSWHITKIEDLATGKKIDFYYEDTSSNPFLNPYANDGATIDFKRAQRSYGYQLKRYTTQYTPGEVLYHYTDECAVRIDVQNKRLKKIVFDQGEIEYLYNNEGLPLLNFPRFDLLNGDQLTQILVKSKTDVVKDFRFKYNYFVSNANVGEFNPDDITGNSYRYWRLKLISFEQLGKSPYKFYYDESIALPPINSYSVDFLGYFNNSPDKATLAYSFQPKAKLFYYPNQFEKSLLPFNITALNPIVFDGYFTRESNSYAKAWTLNQIEYPTGGKTSFIYEPNKFQLFGHEIIGGGIRIAQQTIDDNKGSLRTVNYSYIKTNGTSSGSLPSMPYFGFPDNTNALTSTNYDPQNLSSQINGTSSVSNDLDKWVRFDKSNLNADINTGAYVGYSEVKEHEVGLGKTVHRFTSIDNPDYQNKVYRTPPEMQPISTPSLFHEELIYDVRPVVVYVSPEGQEQFGDSLISRINNNRINQMIANSSLNASIFTDKSIFRGKEIETDFYNESNFKVKTIKKTYHPAIFATYTFNQAFLEPAEGAWPKLRPCTCSDTASGPCGVRTAYNMNMAAGHICATQSCMQAQMVARKDFEIAQFLPASIETTHYDDTGKQLVEKKNFTYTQNGLLASTAEINTNNQILKELYFYPTDNAVISEPNIATLKAKNLINVPLKTEKFSGIEKISENKIEYAIDATTNNLLLPKKLSATIGTGTQATLSEQKLTYDLYDNVGNLLQYSAENGTPVSMIYGYDQTLLIAKIENATYAAISNFVPNLQAQSNAPNNEAALIQALNNLRTSLPMAYVATYTHKPLVGISTYTDSIGDAIFYTYDNLGRLSTVKDKNGNIVSQKNYNYKQ